MENMLPCPTGPTSTIEQLDNLASENHELKKRVQMFERYIHTNECSDEMGWFAFFQPEGEYTHEAFEAYRVNGGDTEEQVIQSLIVFAADALAANSSPRAKED